MKNSTTLLLGGTIIAGLYLYNQSKKPFRLNLGKNEPFLKGKQEGYKIWPLGEDARIVISDINKAGDYAYKVGTTLVVKQDMKKEYDKLIVELFAPPSGNVEYAHKYAQKIFEHSRDENDPSPKDLYFIIQESFLGMDVKNNVDSTLLFPLLKDIRKDLGLDNYHLEYNYLTRLKNRTKKGYETPGYLVAGCKILWIKDLNYSLEYAYDVGKKYDKYEEWISQLLGNCSPESLKSGEKEFFMLFVYSAIGALKGNKNGVPEMHSLLEKSAEDFGFSKSEVPTEKEMIDIIDQYEK